MENKVLDMVERFRENRPAGAAISIDDVVQISMAGDTFRVIMAAYHFGYIRGMANGEGAVSE